VIGLRRGSRLLPQVSIRATTSLAAGIVPGLYIAQSTRHRAMPGQPPSFARGVPGTPVCICIFLLDRVGATGRSARDNINCPLVGLNIQPAFVRRRRKGPRRYVNSANLRAARDDQAPVCTRRTHYNGETYRRCPTLGSIVQPVSSDCQRQPFCRGNAGCLTLVAAISRCPSPLRPSHRRPHAVFGGVRAAAS